MTLVPDADRVECGDEATWHAERRKSLGGSDAPAIVGVDKYRRPIDVFCEKLDLVAPAPTNELMRWGHRLEPVVLDAYEEASGRRVYRQPRFLIYRSRAHPFLHFSPDGLVLAPGREDAGVVQVKTVDARIADEWLDGPPLAYLVQIQHEMLVAGASWGTLVALIGGNDLRWHDVERDPDFCSALVEREAAFHARLVAQTPPDESDPDVVAALLARRFPRHERGLVVRLPADAAALDQLRLAASEQEREWRAVRTAAENRLKTLLGNAEKGILPDGTIYQWRVEARKEHVVAASSTRVLRRLGPRDA